MDDPMPNAGVAQLEAERQHKRRNEGSNKVNQ
jgi:hypothetical protein